MLSSVRLFLFKVDKLQQNPSKFKEVFLVVDMCDESVKCHKVRNCVIVD